MNGRGAASAWTCFGKPVKVLELAALATIISPSILVVTTAGTSQVLSQDGSEGLPLVYVLLAVVSIPLASGISGALGRWRTSCICRLVCWASLFLCLALRAALAVGAPGTPQAICISAYVLEILFDTLFWLSVSEYLTTLELKRHAPFLAMAFGVGGILGGLLATGFCARLPADDLLLLNAALFGVCLIQFRRINRTLPALQAETDSEQDAGIVTAVRSTFVVLRAFPLTAAIAAGIFLMSSLFCLQDYLALTIYAENIVDEDSLASFMALNFAGQQVAELLILAVFGKVVLERAGPLVRNLFFPLTTIAVLLALQELWILPIAVLVHVNANAVSNAVFEPVKNLNYAALPFRMLAPVRMLLEGVVYPAGIALSGGALLWMQTAYQPNAVLAVAIILSILFAATSGLVGIAFLPSLLRSLRLRALSPMEYSNSEPGRRFSRSDVRYLLSHPDPEARSFGRALARRLAPSLLGAAESRAASWRVEPARAPIGWLSSTRGSAFDSPNAFSPPLTRENGAGSQDSAVGDGWHPITISGCADAQHQPAPQDFQLADLGRSLEHPLSSVRRTAGLLLARKGDAAVAVAVKRLSSNRPEVVDAAIRVLGAIRTRKARRVLRAYVRPLYQQARLNLAGLAALQRLAGASTRAGACDDLAEGLLDSNRRILSRVLAVKAALGNRRDINLLRKLAQTDEARVRSDAVEALASLPTGGLIRPLLPLLDANHSPVHGLRPNSFRWAGGADPALALWRAAADDRWISLLAVRALGDRRASPRGSGDELMLDLVLFLKSVPLFRALCFEDIARIAEKTETVSITEGQALFEAGASITHVHVLRSGKIELSSNGMIVDVLKAGTSIGEHAIFGHAEHEVSARAAEDCLLLRFPVGLLADVVAEHPQSLGPITSDLIRRLHELYAYLAETRKVPGQSPAIPTQTVAATAASPLVDGIVMA